MVNVVGVKNCLESTDVERDLGIHISNDLRWDNQISKATRAAQFVLAQIKSAFTCHEPEIIRPLYLALVRPHLEFAVPAWNPHLEQDSKKLEKIQKKATKLCPSLKKKNYEERYKIFQLTKLDVRRERGDLIQLYKIIYGIEVVDWVNEIRCLDYEGDNLPALRRHKHHFYRESKAVMVREKFFINLVVPN
jgi:ribonuclease P/MRP protein subunit RPP40